MKDIPWKDAPWNLKEVFLVIFISYLIILAAAVVFDIYNIQVDLIETAIIQFFLSFSIVTFTLLFLKKHNRSLKDLGLFYDPNLIACGIVLGIVLLFLERLIYYLITPYIGSSPLQDWFIVVAKTWEGLLILLLIGSIFAPVAEEIYFRGFAYPALRKKWGVDRGIVFSGLFFAIAHLDPQAFIPVFLLGMALAYAYEKSGSLLLVMAAHFTVNTTTFVLSFIGII